MSNSQLLLLVINSAHTLSYQASLKLHDRSKPLLPACQYEDAVQHAHSLSRAVSVALHMARQMATLPRTHWDRQAWPLTSSIQMCSSGQCATHRC